jgi:RNA polymerase sigma-70 factor (ECF subfamily)
MRRESQETGNGHVVAIGDAGPAVGLTARKRKAYVQAVKRHYKQVYAFLYHMAGNAATAEDLTQETFLSAWSALDRFEERCSTAVWLHRIALNAYRAHSRGLRNEAELTEETAAVTPDPVRQIEANDLSRLAQEAVAQLPEIYREAIVLRYYQGLKYREVAELLGVPIGTVQFRCHEALDKLRAGLKKEIEKREQD